MGGGPQGLWSAWAQFSDKLMRRRDAVAGVGSILSCSVSLRPSFPDFQHLDCIITSWDDILALILLRIFCDPWICGLSFMNFEKYYIFKYLLNPLLFPMALQSHVKLDHLTESQALMLRLIFSIVFILSFLWAVLYCPLSACAHSVFCS